MLCRCDLGTCQRASALAANLCQHKKGIGHLPWCAVSNAEHPPDG